MGIGVAYGLAGRLALPVAWRWRFLPTALVLQMLQEKGLMQTQAGESAFAVLLMQDIAVIPILIIMPLLAMGDITQTPEHTDMLHALPGWLHAVVVAGVIAGIVFAGRYMSKHLFKFVARTNLREVFTATSLALIVGITVLMQAVGVSPALGAFIAGVVLANSDYKHTIENDLDPFKGLLLGLFFISVGMGMNFHLLAQHPGALLGAVAGLIVLKMAILLGLGRWFGVRGAQGLLFTFALAQGGEFAFVLFKFAETLQIIGSEQTACLTLVVAMSMATTPFLMLINDRYIQPRFHEPVAGA